MGTLARPFRPWEILFDLHLGLRPPAADCDLGYPSAVFQTAGLKPEGLALRQPGVERRRRTSGVRSVTPGENDPQSKSSNGAR